MKKVMVSLFVMAISNLAFATGFQMTVFKCESAVNGPSYELKYFSTSAPGGPANEWYELYVGTSELGPVKTFRLEQLEVVATTESFLQRYVSAEKNKGGTFSLLKIADRIFINSSLGLGSVDGSSTFITNDLVELGTGFVCN